MAPTAPFTPTLFTLPRKASSYRMITGATSRRMHRNMGTFTMRSATRPAPTLHTLVTPIFSDFMCVARSYWGTPKGLPSASRVRMHSASCRPICAARMTK